MSTYLTQAHYPPDQPVEPLPNIATIPLVSKYRSNWTNLHRRPKVVIGHPMIGRGGSESKVMWLIQALKGTCDVTIVTTGGWNLDELNAYYGTRIGEEEVHLRIAPVPIPLGLTGAAFRSACYQRFAQKIAKEYDIRISAYNLTDWGLPATHFIADFSWHQEIRQATNSVSSGFIYRDSILRKLYLAITGAYAGTSGRDVMRCDRLVANSRWSANLMKQMCGVECRTIVYPCVWTEFPQKPWMDREQSFVMIGRIAPEKEIEQAITILDHVRRRGHLISLHLCGHIGDDPYGRQIARLCQKHSDWIIPEGSVQADKKIEVLTRCRFGIQARRAEPFGISVAEMVKAGAIVFAPGDGGQVEILEHNDLLFSSVSDAVDKISDVLSDQAKQVTLRNHLQQRSGIFCTETYIQQALDSLATV